MAGLFDAILSDARMAALEAWRLPELISLAKAGRAMAEYLDSTERERYVRDAKPTTIEQVPLSLDLLRSGLPANVPLYAWLTMAEWAIADALRVELAMELLDIDLRRAGLDFNPGHLAWLERKVEIVFGEG